MHVDGEAEVGRQVTAHLLPGLAGVVAAHDVPVLLHIEHLGARRVPGEAVHAVADLGVLVRDGPRPEPLVHGAPVLPTVVGAKDAGGRDGHEDALGVARVERGSCAGTSRRRPAARTTPSHARGARPARSSSDRHRWSGTGPRPRRRRGPCRDRSARARGARPGRTPKGAACRRTTGGCPARRRTGTGCPPAPRSIPPSSERWISCPNQPLDCEA